MRWPPRAIPPATLHQPTTENEIIWELLHNFIADLIEKAAFNWNLASKSLGGNNKLAEFLPSDIHAKVRVVLDKPAADFNQQRFKIDELVAIGAYPLILAAVRHKHQRFSGETQCKPA